MSRRCASRRRSGSISATRSSRVSPRPDHGDGRSCLREDGDRRPWSGPDGLRDRHRSIRCDEGRRAAAAHLRRACLIRREPADSRWRWWDGNGRDTHASEPAVEPRLPAAAGHDADRRFQSGRSARTPWRPPERSSGPASRSTGPSFANLPGSTADEGSPRSHSPRPARMSSTGGEHQFDAQPEPSTDLIRDVHVEARPGPGGCGHLGPIRPYGDPNDAASLDVSQAGRGLRPRLERAGPDQHDPRPRRRPTRRRQPSERCPRGF